jgi:hypothetical protein
MQRPSVGSATPERPPWPAGVFSLLDIDFSSLENFFISKQKNRSLPGKIILLRGKIALLAGKVIYCLFKMICRAPVSHRRIVALCMHGHTFHASET